MKNRESFGLCVMDQSNRIVLVQQNGASWCMPKGRLETSDADGPACASREFREETGYNVPYGKNSEERLDLVKNIRSDNAIAFAITPVRAAMADVPFLSKPALDLQAPEQEMPKTQDICVQDAFKRPRWYPEAHKTRGHWYGVESWFTYYLVYCQDLDKLDFSGERDPFITDMKFVPLSELSSWCFPQGDKMHHEDVACVFRLVREYKEYTNAVKDGKLEELCKRKSSEARVNRRVEYLRSIQQQ